MPERAGKLFSWRWNDRLCRAQVPARGVKKKGGEKMANEQNLRPSEYKFTDEDRRKATKVRQENLKRRKTFSEIFDAWLTGDHKDKNGNEMNGAEALAQAVLAKAVKGDLKAFELIRDTVGEKPVEKVAKVEIPQEIRDKVESAVKEYGQKSGD